MNINWNTSQFDFKRGIKIANFFLKILNLSNNHHLLIQLQNLLASHDIVAQRDYQPKLSEIPVEVDEDEETIKIVQLVKSQDALVNIYFVVELV